MFSTSVRARFLIHFGAALAVLATSWMSGNCSAAIIYLGQAVQLSTLVNNPEGQVVAGDKKFTGFSYIFTNDMPGPGGVNVVPILDDLGDNNPSTGNYGIEFVGAFLDLVSSADGSNALIRYMVEVTDPRYLISDAHLAGDPSLLGDNGSISVTDTFLPLGANGEYTMTIYDDEIHPTPKLIDWTYFVPPVKKLNVQKGILARAVAGTGPNGNTATLNFVDQTYSQILIPEPTSLLLLVSGCIGLAVTARRRAR